MNPIDLNTVPLPTADTLLFWGFIISTGILVAQLSTRLSEQTLQDEADELEDIAEAEVVEAEVAEAEVAEAEVVEADGTGKAEQLDEAEQPLDQTNHQKHENDEEALQTEMGEVE